MFEIAKGLGIIKLYFLERAVGRLFGRRFLIVERGDAVLVEGGRRIDR